MQNRFDKTCQHNYKIKILRNINELESIKNLWEEMISFCWHPHIDLDLYIATLTTRDEILRPHIIILFRNEKPTTLVIGRIEDIPLEIKFGYKTLLKPLVRSLTIVYGGIVGDTSYQCCKIIISRLMQSLSQHEADVVLFNHLKLDSDIYHFAKVKPNFFCRDTFHISNTHWSLALPPSYNEFLHTLSKNTRKNIRNYSNRLKRDFGQNLIIKHISSVEEIDTILSDNEEIAKKTYKRGMGVGFHINNEIRKWYEIGLKRSILNVYILYVNGQPVAFRKAFCFTDVFISYGTDYDPFYSNYRIGNFLLNYVIEDLYKKGTIKTIDFGFGDADYKRIYCNENWIESPVYIFAPTVKGIVINLMRGCTMHVSSIAQNILKKLNLYSKVKKRWRDQLRKNK